MIESTITWPDFNDLHLRLALISSHTLMSRSGALYSLAWMQWNQMYSSYVVIIAPICFIIFICRTLNIALRGFQRTSSKLPSFQVSHLNESIE